MFHQNLPDPILNMMYFTNAVITKAPSLHRSIRIRHHLLITNCLGVPEHLLGIDHLLDRVQSRIRGGIVIQAVRLCGREAGVDVVRISTKGRLRLSADECIIQPINVGRNGGREVRGPGKAIILDDPKGVPIRVGR